MWLYFISSGFEQLNILVAAASASQLQATIQDAEDCLGMVVTGNKVYGDSWRSPINGSLWQFKNYDDYTKCVGQKCDYLFLNEAVNLDEKSFGTLVQGVRRQIILNFNPTHSCWVDKYVLPDKSNLLITTWQDNPHLTQTQKEEFENIKIRALSPRATIFDRYAYEVFYKGVFTNMAGKVFQQVFNCTDEEFDKIPVSPSYGMDFGFVENRDMTSLVAVKIYNNCIYAKELIYSNNLVNDRDVAVRLSELGMDCYTTISCDMGGMGATRIHNLRTGGDGKWDDDKNIANGFDCINAIKKKVLDNIQEMLQFDKIYVTESSYNLRTEMDNYEIDPNGKPKNADHGIDAMRYAYNFAMVNQEYF